MTSSGGATSFNDGASTAGAASSIDSPGAAYSPGTAAQGVKRSELCIPPRAPSGATLPALFPEHPDCESHACGDPCDPCAQHPGCTLDADTTYACSYDRRSCYPIKPE
jgi:hypothetical protein